MINSAFSQLKPGWRKSSKVSGRAASDGCSMAVPLVSGNRPTTGDRSACGGTASAPGHRSSVVGRGGRQPVGRAVVGQLAGAKDEHPGAVAAGEVGLVETDHHRHAAFPVQTL